MLKDVVERILQAEREAEALEAEAAERAREILANAVSQAELISTQPSEAAGLQAEELVAKIEQQTSLQIEAKYQDLANFSVSPDLVKKAQKATFDQFMRRENIHK